MEGAMGAPAVLSEVKAEREGVIREAAGQPSLAPQHGADSAPAGRRPANDDAATKTATGRKLAFGGRRKLIVGTALALVLAVGGYFGGEYWTVGRFQVSTDDAYVRAHTTTLAAKVPGYISEVLAGDNTWVHAGDVVARIDNGDFKLAVDAAQGKVTSQEATIDRIGRQIVAAQAAVEQAQAQLASAQAGAVRAQSELERQQALAAKDFASKQAYETALANRDQSKAGVSAAQAALDGADANVAVLKAQQTEAARGLDELRTALAKAQRDLGFTEIRAPVDGVIGNRAMQVGDYVQTGQRLAAVVPLDDVYIDANFKETQLGDLKPGQSVAISVDAMPEHALKGVVESVSPASGAMFSLLPPDNATGNFTKIVQRVPVRIRVPYEVASEHALRPGLSVVVSVNTKPGAPRADIASFVGEPEQRAAFVR
jgi:membrane fusion protein (multidrug efflux system)